MDLELAGKAAIVTGGSRGLGRAIALALAAEGARVAICARGEEGLRAAERELRGAGPGPHLALALDVTTPEGVETLVARTAAELGGVDVLVHNVGGSRIWSFAEAGEDDLRTVLDLNFWPAVRLSRRALPELRARGGGAIVLIASIWGREGLGLPALYSYWMNPGAMMPSGSNCRFAARMRGHWSPKCCAHFSAVSKVM